MIGTVGQCKKLPNSKVKTRYHQKNFCYFADMKHLTVVVKPFRAEAVLSVISEFGVSVCTVREAKGYGRQKGYLDQYRGEEFSSAYLPKVEITVCIEEDRFELLADRIAKVARTGRIGDGKLLVVPVAGPGMIEF